MNKQKNILSDLLQSFLIYLALFSDMNLIYPNVYAQPVQGSMTIVIVTFFQRLDALFGSFSFQKDCCLFLIFLVLFLLRRHTSCFEIAGKRFIGICSLLFTVLYLFGHSFYYTNSSAFLFGDAFVFCVSLLRGLGFFFLLRLLLALGYQGIVNLANTPVSSFRYKVTYPKIFLFLVIAWLPQLVIIYPGGYCNDIQDQLMQYFGYVPMADPHPPLFTMIIGTCVWLSNKISHPNLGLFLYILFQYLFMAAGLAYCISYFHQKLQNKIYLLFSLGFIALLPDFSHYASVVIKNAPYAVCLVIMSVCALEIMEGRKKSVYLYTAAALLGSLICHNGIYIAMLMNIVLTFYVIKHFTVKRLKAAFVFGLTLCIILFFIVTKLLYPAMGILKEKDHLLYTNQLQHTCRLLLTHPEEFTQNDLDILSRVIDIDLVPEYYNPVTSDGIKPIVDLQASSKDVEAYRKIWNKQIRRHPLLILEASFNVSYGFWSPVARNEENDFSMYFYESEYPEFNFHVPTNLHGLRNIYEELLENYVSLPIIRLLQNPGFYFWVFTFVLAVLLTTKKRKYLVCMIPGIMTSVYYVGIPAYFHHPRYAFPLIYSTVLYLGILLLALREGENTKIEKTVRTLGKENTHEK